MRTLAILFIALIAALSQAQEINFEYVILASCSNKITDMEWHVQIESFALAFETVVIQLRAVRLAPFGATMVLWAGPDQQEIAVPWTYLSNSEEINSFVDSIRGLKERPFTGPEAVGNAIQFLLQENPSPFILVTNGTRVMEIAAFEAPNENGTLAPITELRDNVTQQGWIISAIVLSPEGNQTGGVSNFYRDNVITLDGFILTAEDISLFPHFIFRAVRETFSPLTGFMCPYFYDITQTSCSSDGSFGFNDDCGNCLCLSGWNGDCCQERFECDLLRVEDRLSTKGPQPRILENGTYLELGNLNVLVEVPGYVGRQTLLGFESHQSGSPCSCFTKDITSDSNNTCMDLWNLNERWSVISEECCNPPIQEGNFITYNCTLYVQTTDRITLPGWEEVDLPDRVIISPLPLYIRFQRFVNLNTRLRVSADIDLKAYVSVQEFNSTTRLGRICITTALLYPYAIIQDNLVYTVNPEDKFLNTELVLSDISCVRDQPGTDCVQQICADFSLSEIDCDLNSEWTFNLKFDCRSDDCPDLDNSLFNGTLVATFESPDFCEGVTIERPLGGTLVPVKPMPPFEETNNFFLIPLPVPSNAMKACILAKMDSGVEITNAWYLSLAFEKDNHTLVLYDNSIPCDACGPENADLELDTAENPDKFTEIAPNEAMACLYLTRGTDENPGLLDDFLSDIDPHTGAPLSVTVVAELEVEFATDGNTKKHITNEPFTAIDNILIETAQIPGNLPPTVNTPTINTPTIKIPTIEPPIDDKDGASTFSMGVTFIIACITLAILL